MLRAFPHNSWFVFRSCCFCLDILILNVFSWQRQECSASMVIPDITFPQRMSRGLLSMPMQTDKARTWIALALYFLREGREEKQNDSLYGSQQQELQESSPLQYVQRSSAYWYCSSCRRPSLTPMCFHLCFHSFQGGGTTCPCFWTSCIPRLVS